MASKKDGGASEISLEDQALLKQKRGAVAAEKYDPEETGKFNKEKIPKTGTQMATIEASVKNIFLFNDLSKDQIKDMIEYMFSKPVKAKEVVIKENDPGDNFYVIEKGIFEAYKGDKLMKKYNDRGYFGELALMYNTPRNATVKSLTDGQLWGLDRESFRRVVLKIAFERRTKLEKMINQNPLFKPIGDENRIQLLDSLASHSYENSVVFKQGEKNEKYFLIEIGEVEIIKNNATKATLKAGSFFGEETILFNRPSSFTAKCKGDVGLGFIEKDAFNTIFKPIIKAMKDNFDAFLKKNI